MSWFLFAKTFTILSLMLALMLPAADAPAQSPGQSAEQDNVFAQQLSNSFRKALRNVLPAVVSIQAERKIEETERQEIPEMFRQFLPEEFWDMVPPPSSNWQGSGVIISPNGEIMTNNHVVDDADELEVTLNDGTELTAKVVATDPESDIALIQLNSQQKTFPYAAIGDSDQLQVGDWVLAIGNPFGLNQSVSEGIVSAKGRTGEDVQVGGRDFMIKNYIQTTAAINPGNSGGPLVNLNGEVVGINNAIQTAGRAANLGIGFAIPSNMAKRVIGDLKEFGRVRRGYIGVELDSLNENLSDYYKQEYGISNGAQVTKVIEGTPGAKAGLQHGDLIIEVDGNSVKNAGHLVNLVTELPVGKEVDLKIFRKGETKTLNITLAERPTLDKINQITQPELSLSEELMGLSVETFSSELAEQFNYEEKLRGVVVTNVRTESVFRRGEVQVGDTISEFNDQPVENVDDFNTILSDVQERMRQEEVKERVLLLYVHRPNNPLYPKYVAPTIKIDE